MKKEKLLLLLILLSSIIPDTIWAQRIQQPLGRGVVAVKNGNNVFISWRKLAQEPEDALYNVYVDGKKLNSTPLEKSHYQTTAGNVPAESQVTVTLINDKQESAHSNAYTVRNYDLRNMFMSIRFDASPLNAADYNTDYVWPADLDGDGEMDYVINRKSNTNGLDCYVEAYLRTGEHLWTVKLGPNELSCAGQDDMILAYDMDCDGKADVVMQTSDGTQFWDADKKGFGLYVGGHTTGDTDDDGIINYETQSSRNAPRYMTVVDGMTGKEKHSVEQTYNSAYNRTNRAALMGDEYNKHVGHVGVFYPDGIHPAVIMEWHTRNANGSHNYHNSAFAYDFSGGKAGAWKELFCKPTGGPAFHQIRIADVDGDGRDEMQTGGYTMDDDGSTLNNPGIAHGDRFRTSDIDPEHPGLETFAIQQNAGDMLGQILYDASTGEAIKKWYLAAVGDVGRGECMDIDPNHLGWEMWSTMGGVYNAQGSLIPEHAAPYPTEGIWWDSDPDREIVQTSDSHYNVYIQDFYKGRLIEIAKLSNWRYVTVYAKRAAFWGDIIGDWREELILLHKENGVCVGIVGFATDYTTNIDNIYCLQEDPAYRGQCTTKGYYQSPNPGFYLGYNMPRPQLPPCMVADLIWKSTGTFTNYERSATATYTDGKSLLLDLTTDESLSLTGEMKPSIVYAMPVKGQTITLNGNGSLSGTMELWKSQAGRVAVNTPMKYTGKTVISEGTLEANTEIISQLALRARGTLAGNATVNEIVLEGALNYEGGRMAPGAISDAAANQNGFDDFAIGTITFKQGLNINKRLFMEIDIVNESAKDLLEVKGNLTVTAPAIFSIRYKESELQPGRYKLITYSGDFHGEMKHFAVRGLTGLSYSILNEDNAIWLVINKQREATTNVLWTGNESNTWDYQTPNFVLSDGNSTGFVANDEVIFTDDATSTNITLNELMPIKIATFSHDTKTYTLGGEGGLSGKGQLIMKGKGTLVLNATQSDYTGATIIQSGTVSIKELADGGMPSAIGAATASAENWQIGKAKLIINSSNTSTNRGLTLTDTATIQISNGSTALKGVVKGNGALIKTGGGQLNLNAANSYSGGTILKAGTIAQGSWDATFGQLGSSINVENGTIRIFDQNSTSTVPNFNYKVTVPSGKKLTLETGQRCQINGSFHGEGDITITIPYVRTDISANWSDFKGTLTVTGRDFRLNKAMNMKQMTLNMASGVSMGHYKTGDKGTLALTSEIGALASTATDAWVGNGTYHVGYNNTKATFAGTLASTIRKYGTADWTLTGTGNTNVIYVHEGVLIVNNTSGTAAGTVHVQNGGTLRGKGTVNSVSLKNGGKLKAGQSDILTGTLNINGALNSEGGSTIALKITKVKNDVIHVKGNINLKKDTLEIISTNRTFTIGEEFMLFDFEKDFQGELIVKGTPGDGMAWDTSKLLSEGILKVVAESNGIHTIGNERVKIYPQVVQTECHIDASQACHGQIELCILDTGGRIVSNTSFEAQKPHTVNMNNYAPGVYFIRMTNNGETLTTRIIKRN